MTDITRSDLLELVDGRVNLYQHDAESCFARDEFATGEAYERLARRYEHLRLVVERADGALFKEEK